MWILNIIGAFIKIYTSRDSRYIHYPIFASFVTISHLCSVVGARLDALEGHEREIIVAIVEMKVAMNQLSLDTIEKWERMERRMVE